MVKSFLGQWALFSSEGQLTHFGLAWNFQTAEAIEYCLVVKQPAWITQAPEG